VGDIVLRVGDTLLVEAHTSFVEQQRGARDFSLVSRLDGASPPTSAQAPLSLLILLGMIGLVTTGLLSMLQAALLAAAAMLLFRCCSEETARQSIDWPLLLAIGASFGLGTALEQSGAAKAAAHVLLAPAGANAWLALVLIYAATSLLSNLVTNNAAAVIVFPIAISTAEQLGVNHIPFAIVLMVAASASFATPLGYQTNLMVYAPGNYRFSDFIKMGVPMNILVGVVTCLIAPLVWPFR
jgi:di/tricarboxylate transporter